MVAKKVDKGPQAVRPILSKLENLGYYLLPRTHAHSPGHSGLIVLLNAGPRPDIAFVPHSLETRVIGYDHRAHRTTFEAGTTSWPVRTVTAGKIVLRDLNGQEAEFFIFGGTMMVETVEGGTVYSFYSRPPLLTLRRTYHSVGTHLAVEVEVLLAELRALLPAGHKTFQRPLAEVDPFQLYLSCLDAILARYRQVVELRRHYRDFYQALRSEKAWLVETDQWPEEVTTLTELLGLQDRDTDSA